MENDKNIILAGDFNCPDIDWTNMTIKIHANDREIQKSLIEIIQLKQDSPKYMRNPKRKKPPGSGIYIKRNANKILDKHTWHIRSCHNSNRHGYKTILSKNHPKKKLHMEKSKLAKNRRRSRTSG
jgi:hypothetical protein